MERRVFSPPLKPETVRSSSSPEKPIPLSTILIFTSVL